jgi:hypothetical protein
VTQNNQTNKANQSYGSKKAVPSEVRIGSVADSTAINIKLLGSLSAVNEIASSLSVTFLRDGFLKSYQDVLVSHEKILSSLPSYSNQLELVSSVISPMSGILASATAVMADIGLANANATRLLALDPSVLSRQSWTATQDISDLLMGSIYTNQLSGLISEVSSIDFEQIASSARMISSGTEKIIRALPSYPKEEPQLPDLEIVREAGEISEIEIQDHQKRLDEMLRKIDPELVNYRVGCWAAYYKKNSDYIGQASSSMRRLVDELLRKLAPTEEVSKTDYFKNREDAKDKSGHPTRKARILHIVKYDTNKTEHLKRLADGLLETYANLSAWDHVPLKKDTFVQGAFIAIEGHLLSLLSEVK